MSFNGHLGTLENENICLFKGEKTMIPKVIHYCWFGRAEKPKLAIKCIESWRRYCPDYEIIEWNEDNYDVNSNSYTKYCYENKKWAFLSDYVRLDIVARHGGLYFDTDVQLIKNFDDLLQNGAFYCFESEEFINTGEGFGAVQGHPSVIAMKAEYDMMMDDSTKQYDMITCPQLNTKALLQFGLTLNGTIQRLADILILSSDFMNPYDDTIGKLCKTENTISIHWYSKSWLKKRFVIKSVFSRPLHRIRKLLRLR